MSNRIGIPEVAKSTQGREIHSTRVFWEEEKGELVLSSYCAGTSKGKTNVLTLFTVQPILGVISDDEKVKPAIYKLYDFYQG